MKKLLGLTLATATVMGFASVLNVHALAPVASNFKNAQTRSRLKFNYNLDTLETNKVQIKFGGPIAIANYDAAAEHGVIVVPEAEYNTLAPENQLLDAKAFEELNKKKYVLPFTEEEIATVEDKDLGQARQYAWVIDSKVGYDYGFAAVMYEKKDATITLAKPAKQSISSLVNNYLGDKSIDEKIKKVLDKYTDQVQVKNTVSLDTIMNSITEGNQPSGKYEVFAYCWYEGKQDVKFTKATLNTDTNAYSFECSAKCDKVLFVLMPEGSTDGDWNSKLCKTIDLKLENSKALDSRKQVTYNEVTKNIAGRWMNNNGQSTEGKTLYAWVSDYNKGAHFVEVVNDTFTTTDDMHVVKFAYFKNDKPEWGENGNNIFLESETMSLNSDEFGYNRRLAIDEAKICANIAWQTIDKGQFKIWARCWDSKDSEPVPDKWYEVAYSDLEISAKYDRVIFVIRDKNDGPGFDGRKAQTRDYKIENGYVLYD